MEVLREVKWINETYFVVGDGRFILVSTDGITWDEVPMDHAGVLFKDIAWNGSEYIVVGEKLSILASEDGKRWVDVDNSSLKNQIEIDKDLSINNIVWEKDTFIAVGDDGIIISSKDGKTWALVSAVTYKTLEALNNDGDFMIAVGKDGTIVKRDKHSAWVNLSKLSADDSKYSISEEEKQIKVLVDYPFKRQYDITKYADYEVLNENIAQITKDGLIKGLNEGKSIIRVTYDSLTLEIPITVEFLDKEANENEHNLENNLDKDEQSDKKVNIVSLTLDLVFRLTIIIVLLILIMYFVRKMKK